jgi:hypothetical protein
VSARAEATNEHGRDRHAAQRGLARSGISEENNYKLLYWFDSS